MPQLSRCGHYVVEATRVLRMKGTPNHRAGTPRPLDASLHILGTEAVRLREFAMKDS